MKVLPVLLAVLVLLSGLPLMMGVSQAENSTPTDYPAKEVMVSSFDMTDHTLYGDWYLDYPTNIQNPYPAGSANFTTGYDINEKTQGSASRTVAFSFTSCDNAWGSYVLTIPADVPRLRHYTVQFDYMISFTGECGNVSVDLAKRSYIDESNGLPFYLEYTYSSESLESAGVGKWNTWTGSLYDPFNDNTKYDLKFWFNQNSPATTNTGEVILHIDNVRFIAPECKVRFSYYNAYTGLGLQSDLLIPEVWHDGVWQRVWNNEYSIAAGEKIAYRVTDYFGQVIAFVPELWLNDTAAYVDLPVKLVKVHITKPAWYTTDLPPSWWLTYTATGTEIPVEGWDLELIAGFYSFRWDTMLVDKGEDPMDENDDIVVKEGNIGQYIDGNLTTGQSFTISDFYLSMKPSYRSEAESNVTVISAGFLTWEGLAKLCGEVVDEISGNVYYRSIMLAMGIGGVVTFVSTYYNMGRKKAAQKLKEGKI